MNNGMGAYVKSRRQDMGLSLREFAALCGISHTHVNSIERGYDLRSGKAVNPTSSTISKLAAALCITEGELLRFGKCGEMPSEDEALKLALFGDKDASDELLSEVREFACFIKQRDRNK